MRLFLLSTLLTCAALAAGLTTPDLRKLRSVSDVRFSPDGKRIAYVVSNNDTDARPYSQLWVMTLSTGESVRLAQAKESSSEPEWSPDSSRIAYSGKLNGKSGLIVANPDGSGGRFIVELSGTNSPLPSTGKRIAWAPDGNRIAYVTALPGPETSDASGDPIVITRYLYKPDADEGNTRFNDNKRLHIFVADLSTGATRQLTTGVSYNHSVHWSPKGDEIAFITNRDADSDQFFNYDIYAWNLASGAMRRITATENIEYRPRWSPDASKIVYQGCKRGLTDLETTMEDTHLWMANADGSNRREFVTLDHRQGEPHWSPDGQFVYFTAAERGNVRLYRSPVAGGTPQRVVGEPGTVGAVSVGPGGQVAYAMATPNDLAQLYLLSGTGPAKKLTDLNAEALRGKDIAVTEPFTYISNDNKWEIQAYLTKPVGMTNGSKHPLAVVIHGGPHSQQGPSFNFRHQVYAAKGWGVLMVNYRGSVGYGQAFADAVFGDQNGNEAQDVLYGVSAAIRRNPWIDRDRIVVEGVSYGGQLSAWLITQTNIFKSAIPTAAIINNVSYNYMTYYNQYEQMTFGIFPHQGDLMDELWRRSALRYVSRARTPTMLVHGENDNDVCIAEAEQYYVALKDVGTEAIFVRYPREGHGIREVKHIIDWTERSMRWHEAHFPK
jgi:dipeptidyl aminopeptidase/acylaminoacyl peptidase